MKLPSESPATFITLTFSLLGKIAASDGKVSADEIHRVERYVDKELQLEPKLKALAMQVFADAFDSPLEVRDYAEKFSSTFRDKVQMADQVVELLLCLSAADGAITTEEDQLVRSAALLLGLSTVGYNRLKEKVGLQGRAKT